MRFTEVQCPEGHAYIDPGAIDAVGPVVMETISGRTLSMRCLYLRGGASLVILETPANLNAIGVWESVHAH